MYMDNHLTWLFTWNAKNELYFNLKIWLKKAAIRWSPWSFIIRTSWQEGTDAAWRSRCRAGRGTIALDGCHPSWRLQADNWPWQVRGCLLTWPRQSRRRRLSRSLATSEEMLSVVMPCLGKFGEPHLFILGYYPFKKFIYFNWRIITLQYHGGFLAVHQHELAMGIHVSPCHILIPPSTSLPTPSLWVVPEHGLWVPCFMRWSSVLHVVMYLFQRYSLKSSHPHLLPLSPKLCNLCLRLHCCPACRIVSTIFLNPYICVNTQYLSFSFWPTSLYVIGSRFIHLLRTDSNAFLSIAE